MRQMKLIDRVQENAFSTLTRQQRASTNLFIDERVYRSGEAIGPPMLEIVAERPTLLVFADDKPRANFAHPCRYFLYDAESGDLDRIEPAEFPPFVKAPPSTLKPFHQPVQFLNGLSLFRSELQLVQSSQPPLSDRHAILYSGMSNQRHLNDLEFLYRVLVDKYRFDPANIYALSYDGTLKTQDGMPTNWPGNKTPYRIKLTDQGTRAALEAAVDALKARIQRNDLLLVHTNGHGSYKAGTANLNTYPSWLPYAANEFADKLAELPAYRRLIVIMQQCHSGGFNIPIINKSKADATSVASAATEFDVSWSTPDGDWDKFALDWISAQAGGDPFGHDLYFDPDKKPDDDKIAASEAFNYAEVVQDPDDSPNFSKSSAAGAAIALGA